MKTIAKVIDFEYSETHYQNYLTRIQVETGLKLTEFEAGLFRALLDIRKKEGEGGAAYIGGQFKADIKRAIALKLIHADTYKYTGMAKAMGKVKEVIKDYLTEAVNI
jgi:hypothetical protein